MHILGGGELEPEEGYNHIPPLYEQYDTLHTYMYTQYFKSAVDLTSIYGSHCCVCLALLQEFCKTLYVSVLSSIFRKRFISFTKFYCSFSLF